VQVPVGAAARSTVDSCHCGHRGGHLLERRRSAYAGLAFLSDVRAGRYALIESLSVDLGRVAELAAKYDDLLDIHLTAAHTRVKIRFEYKVHRAEGDVALALGHTVHVCVGKDGKPTRAPDWLLQALEGKHNG